MSDRRTQFDKILGKIENIAAAFRQRSELADELARQVREKDEAMARLEEQIERHADECAEKTARIRELETQLSERVTRDSEVGDKLNRIEEDLAQIELLIFGPDGGGNGSRDRGSLPEGATASMSDTGETP